MQDTVRVSAPQDLDGDVFDDDYETCVDVSWSRNHVAAAPLPPSFLLYSHIFPATINKELVTNTSGGPK